MTVLPNLDSIEVRVLGVLMEKEKTTPEYYPMTLNALVNGCNQKSSRNPVVNYDETAVQIALDGLKKWGLAYTVTGGGSRVLKFKQNSNVTLDIEEKEEAALCLLFLRGPLTPGEINSNSGRLFEFSGLEEVQRTLESLASKEFPLVKVLSKRPGQKEARYAHLLSGEPAEDDFAETTSTVQVSGSRLEERVAALEMELAELKSKLRDLL